VSVLHALNGRDDVPTRTGGSVSRTRRYATVIYAVARGGPGPRLRSMALNAFRHPLLLEPD